MTANRRSSLLTLSVITGWILVWTIVAMLYLSQKSVALPIKSLAVLIALGAVAPAVWFLIREYVLKWPTDPIQLPGYARDLWIAIGVITVILTIRSIVITYFSTLQPGPVAWNLVVDVIKISIWPVVVILSLALFRGPIGAFLTALGSRASKIGAFNVSIELTSLPEARGWSGLALNDLKSEYPGIALDSSGGLTKAIADATHADYLIVNLEDGEAWLTSRLFILASVIPRVRSIKRLVFLSNPTKQFVGEARPADVAAALARKYEWLEQAYLECHVNLSLASPGGCKLAQSLTMLCSLNVFQGTAMLAQFLSKVQLNKSLMGKPSPTDTTGWVEFTHYYEHAQWLTRGLLEELMREQLNKNSVQHDPAANESALGRTLLRYDSEYVAIVDVFNRFHHLIDRRKALDEVFRRETAG